LAKVVITIEDKDNGNVKVTSEPNFETMVLIEKSGNQLTSAHGYAMRAVLAIRERSKEIAQLNGRDRIIIPAARVM